MKIVSRMKFQFVPFSFWSFYFVSCGIMVYFSGIVMAEDVMFRASFLQIEEFDCFKMELKLRMEIQQSWKEENQHLQLLHLQNFTSSLLQSPPTNLLLLDSSNRSIFLSPDIYVDNARDMETSNLVWTLNHEGIHVKIDRIVFRVGCIMDFSIYPFDHQRCYLHFGSPNLSVRQYILYNSKNETVDHLNMDTKDIFISHFVIVKTSMTVRNVSKLNDKFSEIFTTIHVKRLWTSYFTSYFLSLSSFDFISFLTLWLVYPKISVIVNFFNIIMVNLFLLLHRTNLDIPKVYYVTTMDVYSLTCIIFIFFVLFVNVYVLYYIKSEEEDDEERANRRRVHDLNIRKEHKYAVRNKNPMSSIQEFDESSSGSATNPSPTTCALVQKKLLDRVRRNSHWTLLITFLLFNFIFWITMLSIHYLQ